MDQCGGSSCEGRRIVIETGPGKRDEEVGEFLRKERPLSFSWTRVKFHMMERLLWFLKGTVSASNSPVAALVETFSNLLVKIDVSMEYPFVAPDVEELTSERDEYREEHLLDTKRIAQLEEQLEIAAGDRHSKIEGLEDRVSELQGCHDAYLSSIEDYGETAHACGTILTEAGIPEKIHPEGTLRPPDNYRGEAPLKTLTLDQRVGMLAAKFVELQNRMKPQCNCQKCHGPLVGGSCPACQGDDASYTPLKRS